MDKINWEQLIEMISSKLIVIENAVWVQLYIIFALQINALCTIPAAQVCWYPCSGTRFLASNLLSVVKFSKLSLSTYYFSALEYKDEPISVFVEPIGRDRELWADMTNVETDLSVHRTGWRKMQHTKERTHMNRVQRRLPEWNVALADSWMRGFQ